MKPLNIIMCVGALCVLLSSCRCQKETLYFQDVEDSAPALNAVPSLSETVIYPGDMLTIFVSTLDQTSAMPFNLPAATYLIGRSQNVGQTTANFSSQNYLQTYLVDREGMIQFPVLGQIKIGGMKKTDVINLLQSQLATYLKDPIVTINIINFQVAVIGEVKNPGRYTIQNERVTLLEALAMAGDLTIYGKRKNVMVFRIDENGEKTVTKIDLTSKDLFSSPFYFLRQNDVVYVEPNRAKSLSSRYSPNLQLFISAFNAAISTASLIYGITK